MYNSNVFHVNLVYSRKYSLDEKQTDLIDSLDSLSGIVDRPKRVYPSIFIVQLNQ